VLNFTILKQIRQQVYDSFEQGADALFNLCDALLTETQARSLPELSQSPLFERCWPSVYQALQQGRIKVEPLQRLWIDAFREETSTDPIWISVDSSSIARPEAQTSEDRGIIYVPNLPRARKPISVGWQFSTIMLLPQEPSSWVGILAQERIATQQTAIEVGIAQLRAVVPQLGRPVIVLADRWYATADFLQACKALGCQVLIRLKSNRKLYRRVSPPSGKKGRPALDGPVFQPKRADTLGEPEAEWSGTSPTGKPLRVRRWSGLHFRQARDVLVTVVQVYREAATDSKRDPRESWFVLLDASLPLSQIAPVYERRFSHEHGYRYVKQDLFWSKVHVRTPEQFERWSIVVSIVMNQLRLARDLGQACYRPWERRRRVVTPRQVRRVMSGILAQVGTPACRCQRRGKSPGRALGFHPKPAPRHPVIVKRPKTPSTPSG
jgi:hypothetical protein